MEGILLASRWREVGGVVSLVIRLCFKQSLLKDALSFARVMLCFVRFGAFSPSRAGRRLEVYSRRCRPCMVRFVVWAKPGHVILFVQERVLVALWETYKMVIAGK